MNDFKREGYGPSAEETELGTVLTTNPEYNLTHGQTQLERGLKSRHIQFLALGMCRPSPLSLAAHSVPTDTPQAVPLEPVSSWAPAVSSPTRAPRLSSWPTSP